MARCKNRRRNPERGFALLLVFLMASVVAIMLYVELPRYAMQAQRDKEEKLIDRGEQYKRAIQLFYNKARRYPTEIKDLENFNNQRFLRQRYADPMTGKDEWRLIHVQNGVLTDSKLTKAKDPNAKDEAKTPNGFVGEQVGLGGSENQGQSGGAASARDRRRPSEGANSTMPGQGPAAGDPSGGQYPLPGQGPDGGPGTSATGQPGQPYPPGTNIPGQPGYPGQPGQPGYPGMPGVNPGGAFQPGGATVTGSQPGDPGNPGQTPPGQPGTGGGMPQGFPQPGTAAGQGNAAADMIRNILTTPRPGGMPMGNAGGQTIGGGIAGVASTAEGEGVKVYNERTLYQEWEFIFDPAKQKQIPNPNGSGLGGTPAGSMNTPQPGQQQGGAPGMPPPTPPQMGRPPGQ